jgi:hypothetical protein
VESRHGFEPLAWKEYFWLIGVAKARIGLPTALAERNRRTMKEAAVPEPRPVRFPAIEVS